MGDVGYWVLVVIILGFATLGMLTAASWLLGDERCPECGHKHTHGPNHHIDPHREWIP